MRLAVVTTHPPGRGSLCEYGRHLLHALRRNAAIDEVIALTDALPEGEVYLDQPAAEGLAALRFEPCWRFGAWDNALRIRRAVKRLEPDGVLFNLQFASFGAAKVPATLGLAAPALLNRWPSIVFLHNIMETVDLASAGFADKPLVERAIRFFGRQATRMILRADRVALTIPKYVEILEREYGADNVFLALHGHGTFEGSQDDPSGLTSAGDHPYDLPAGPMQIMTFGKFGTYKKVEVLVEAFRILQAGDRGPLELVIAGSDNPNVAGYLEGVRKHYADVPDIRFTGYVAEEDVPRLFGEAAVVVFPYTSTTGSSGVLHQAGEFGKAVVLPHLGDFAEVIAEEGFAAEFFEPTDPQSLADAIARIIDDPVRRIDLGITNYLAAGSRPIVEVADWVVLHLEALRAGAPTRRRGHQESET